MKLKILFATAFLTLAACSSMMKDQSRNVAETESSESQSAACVATFTKAREKLLVLIAAHHKEYPAAFVKGIAPAISKAKVTCVNETIPEYGTTVRAADLQIFIENRQPSLGNLFTSDIGRAGMAKYQVDERSAYYDRVMVALAAHTYGQVLGLDDSKYDLFFKTLKLLEQ